MKRHHFYLGTHCEKMSTTANTTGFKDNKEADEVKNALLNIKSQSSLESCPHRKTPVSQDIGTLHYDGKEISRDLLFSFVICQVAL